MAHLSDEQTQFLRGIQIGDVEQLRTYLQEPDQDILDALKDAETTLAEDKQQLNSLRQQLASLQLAWQEAQIAGTPAILPKEL